MFTLPTLEASGLFDTFAGLPLHPLIVHVAVVILPLGALALVLLAFVPKWATRYGWLAVAGIAAGTVAAFVAKESGESLAQRVGEPAQHASYGDLLPPVALALLVLSALWLVAVKRSAGRKRASTARLVVGLVAAAVALATIGLTVAVGHTGAQAVWGDVVAQKDTQNGGDPSKEDPGDQDGERPGEAATTAPSIPSPTSSPTADPASGTYSLADVAKHKDASSCWAAINNNVYDLTDWIDQHPGGPNRILAICGTDATAAFQSEHGGETRPAAELANFRIGTLG